MAGTNVRASIHISNRKSKRKRIDRARLASFMRIISWELKELHNYQ